MAYTPINWQTGDTITAEKLNKMDNGWSIENTQLFSETVTTTGDGGIAWGDFTYNTPIRAKSITVTFNGTDYNVSGIDNYGTFVYGEMVNQDPVFTNYPFFIVSDSSNLNSIATQSAGTYTIVVSAEVATTSDDFNEAVSNCADTSTMPMLCVSGVTTSEEIVRAYYADKRILYFEDDDNAFYFISQIQYTTETEATITYYPSNTLITVSITNGVFTVTNA